DRNVTGVQTCALPIYNHPQVSMYEVHESHIADSTVIHDGEVSVGHVYPDASHKVSKGARAEKQHHQHRRYSVSVEPCACFGNTQIGRASCRERVEISE